MSNSAYNFKTTPYEKQREALIAGLSRPGFAYLMDMGTGKTKVDIDDSGWAYLNDEIDAWLIVAPKGVYHIWKKEIGVHMSDDVVYRVYVWSGKTTIKEKKTMKLFDSYDKGLPVLVVNVEALSSKTSRALKYVKEFISRHRHVKLTVDESTRVKNEKSTRTKMVLDIALDCVRRRILTGSPAPQGPLDLYSQFEIVKPRCLGTSYWTFRARYAVLREIPHPSIPSRTVKIPVGYRNMEELRDKVSQHSYRCRLSDIVEIQELFETYDCTMTPDQERAYESMRSQWLYEVSEGEWASATTAVANLVRLHQITSGYIVDEEGNVCWLSDSKTQALMEVVEDIRDEEKIVIWCAFRKAVEDVTAALSEKYGPESVVQYHGGVSSADRERNIEEFQSGFPRFLVGTPHTGGMGITLTAARYTIYHSNTFDLEHRMQSERRTRRIGQEGMCVYIDIRCPNTIDDHVIKNLQKKINIHDLLTGDEVRKWLSL